MMYRYKILVIMCISLADGDLAKQMISYVNTRYDQVIKFPLKYLTEGEKQAQEMMKGNERYTQLVK